MQKAPLLLLLVAPVVVSCAPKPLSIAPPASAPPPSAAPAPPAPFVAPAQVASPPARAPLEERPMYRLDFVLTAREGNGAPSETAFVLNLPEHEPGEMMVGQNVRLEQTREVHGTVPPGGVALSGFRQDVGTKVKASYKLAGGDLLVAFTVELTAMQSPTSIGRVFAVGHALAVPGRPTMITKLDDSRRKIDLTVTPTKLR